MSANGTAAGTTGVPGEGRFYSMKYEKNCYKRKAGSWSHWRPEIMKHESYSSIRNVYRNAQGDTLITC